MMKKTDTLERYVVGAVSRERERLARERIIVLS